MGQKGMTIGEATYMWVNEFNAIPQGMISKLMEIEPIEWVEVTTPSIGDKVWYNGEQGEIVEDNYDGEPDLHCIEFDDRDEILAEDEFDVERDSPTPMWGMMWSFGDSADEYWLEEKDGIRKMSECGFRIYHNDEYGYFFGIDGAGYDFYESHWIPLYKARGLQWHDPDTEKEAE